jgi:hypothetical protein
MQFGQQEILLDAIEYRAWKEFGPDGEFRRLVRTRAKALVARAGEVIRIVAPTGVELERVDRPEPDAR